MVSTTNVKILKVNQNGLINGIFFKKLYKNITLRYPKETKVFAKLGVMSSFLERQKSLFDHLKDAEEQYGFSKTNKASEPQDYGVVDRKSYRRLKHEMKQFRGKESIYKRQDANIKQCLKSKKLPDHITNPQKWVYYSLSDVTPEQMSEATNTATALSYIREMEERQGVDTKMDHDSVDKDEGIFKKPTFLISSTFKKKNPSTNEDEKITFKSTKVLMPEYVVGVTKKKEKKHVNKPKDGNTEKKLKLKLNHLYEEDN